MGITADWCCYGDVTGVAMEMYLLLFNLLLLHSSVFCGIHGNRPLLSLFECHFLCRLKKRTYITRYWIQPIPLDWIHGA